MKTKTFALNIVLIISLIYFIFKLKSLAAFIVISFIIIFNLSFIALSIGGYYYNKDEINRSYKYFKSAYMLWNSSLEAKMSYANILLRQANIEEAEKVLKEIISMKLKKDDEIKAKALYSIILWKTNRLDEAIEMLTLLDKESKNAVLYRNLGYFLILKGDYSKSLKYNLGAYDYDNLDIGIIDNLALNYCFIGDSLRAIELYKTLLPMYHGHASVYYNYAIALLSQNKADDALENLIKALECKFPFTSIVKKEQIESKISEIKLLASKGDELQ